MKLDEKNLLGAGEAPMWRVWARRWCCSSTGTIEKGSTMFYAEYCPYGLRAISDGDKVMRFVTRAERDEMVERINAAHWDSIEGVCAPITRKEAARSYRIQDFDPQNYPSDCKEVRGLRTCAGRAFFEVTRK